MSEMSYSAGKIFSIDGRPDIPSNDWARAKRRLSAMSGIRSGDERHKRAANPASSKAGGLAAQLFT
ncbi:hypothetical protein DENIT_13237 [Pseudomonas veronii]|nr:hypothetical protein DENIT_13237 [Pseudomonas veronii]